MLLPIVLMVIGIGLVVLEIFVPSMGIITLCAAASVVFALILGFAHSTVLGVALALGGIFAIPVVLLAGFRVFPDTPLGRHMMLVRAPDAHPAPATVTYRKELVGKEGIARSRLRPSGVADVEGERITVTTRGELIEVGSHIRIIENRGNRIVVKAIDEPPAKEEEELR